MSKSTTEALFFSSVAWVAKMMTGYAIPLLNHQPGMADRFEICAVTALQPMAHLVPADLTTTRLAIDDAKELIGDDYWRIYQLLKPIAHLPQFLKAAQLLDETVYFAQLSLTKGMYYLYAFERHESAMNHISISSSPFVKITLAEAKTLVNSPNCCNAETIKPLLETLDAMQKALESLTP